MPMRSYNNNERQLTNTTYSPVSFSNPESKIMPSRISIAYFNKLMKISIALRNNAGSNDKYATYDTDNQISVYVSFGKAYMLYHMIQRLREQPGIHNVCIELKNGLLKISDGSEFGSNSPCISISYADESGNVNEVVYETKTDIHTAAYNYSDGQFSTEVFSNLEVDLIALTLCKYYEASTYAVAATVMEAGMYKRNSQYELIRSIAEKVGASTSSSKNSGGNFNNKTFLSGTPNNTSQYDNSDDGSMVPKGYDIESFESFAASMA